MTKEERAEIRRLVADYIGSEGCSCCRGDDHDKHGEALAKDLKVRRHSDGSGYDFAHYRTDQ